MEDIDEIILEEFPYPIALAYGRMLETDDPTERTNRAIRVFHFSIRAITFTSVIQYLMLPPDTLNDNLLNDEIDIKLKAPTALAWVNLLRLTLRAYRDHPDLLFIPELYNLYWDTSGNAPTPKQETWNLLNLIAKRHIGTVANETQERADEIADTLRQVMRLFLFIRAYDLLYIRDVDERRMSVEVYRGQEKVIKNLLLEFVSNMDKTHIHPEYFYLRDEHNRLLELHPLVINSDYIRDVDYPDDTGVYENYIGPELTDDSMDVKMAFFMLRANKLRDAVASGSGKEAITLFQDLYRRLAQKQEAYTPLKPVNAENLRTYALSHSEQQSKNALQKYIPEAFIERKAFNALFETFLQGEEPILVISGNVGVGKTNLILHFYLQELLKRKDVIPLWFDGASMKADITIAQSIFNAWANLDFGQPIDDRNTSKTLQSSIQQHIPNRQLILLIDGVNENNTPLQLFGQINDFAFDFQSFRSIRIIATTRPQVWQQACSKYLGPRYKPYNYFHRLTDQLRETGLTDANIENDSFVLKRYDQKELESAYSKYTAYYGVGGPELSGLSRSLRQAIQEPLLLRFVCETYETDKKTNKVLSIPRDKRADEIITDLIKRYTADPNKNLDTRDIKFLETWIVPQFFSQGGTPVAVLTRKMLLDVQVPIGITGITLPLDQLITDPTEYSDGTAVNVQAQRLMDTGWLVLEGTPYNYTLRFRYEYYYDYFVGKYVLQQYEAAPQKSEYFNMLIRHLNAAPFLWGTLRNLLVDILKRDEYPFVAQLGYTDDDFQFELLRSVLIEYYDEYADNLRPILLNWLKDTQTQAPFITCGVAIALGNHDLLVQTLQSPRKEVRYYVAQHIHVLWTGSNGHQLVHDLLHSLRNRLSFFRLRRTVALLDTLFRVSLLLALQDYARNGYDRDLLAILREVWQPLLNKVLLKSRVSIIEKRMLHFRRWLLRRIFIPLAMTIVRGLEEGLFFSFKDFRDFFPASPYRHQVFQNLIPHIEAGTGQPDLSVDQLVDYVKELVTNNDNDFLTAGLVFTVLVAHSINDIEHTAFAVNELFQLFQDIYPPTMDPNTPTAESWVFMTHLSIDLLTVINLSPEAARPTLEVKLNGLRMAETRYLCTWRTGDADHKPQRYTVLGDVVPVYILGLHDEGQALLSELLNFYVARDDHDQIIKGLNAIAAAISFFGQPHAPFEALHDALVILQSYIQSLKDKPEYTRFWRAFTQNVINGTTIYRDALIAFVEGCPEGLLPDDVRVQLSKFSAGAGDQFDVTIAAQGILFGNRALREEDNFIRKHILEWAFLRALESPSLEILLVDSAAYLANMIYGDKIVALDETQA